MDEFVERDLRFREGLPDEGSLRDFLERLTGLGPRLMGTEGEARARRFLAEELASFGLDVRLQAFETDSYRRGRTEVALLAGGGALGLEGLALECSPPTAGTLRLELVDLGEGMDKDFERVRPAVAGRAVYASRVWSRNYRRASEAGAKAYLEPSSPSFDEIRLAYMPPDRARFSTPRIRLAHSSGRRVEEALAGEGPVEISVEVTGETVRAETGNLEAFLPGRCDLAPLLVGAHVDSFGLAPGAVDDGSGIACVVLLARAFSAPPPPRRPVRFLLFTGEEDDKAGSRRYVAERLPLSPPPALYFNFDVPYGGPLVLHVMAGEEDSLRYWTGLGRRLGRPFEAERNMRRNSDHYPFYRAGVPCLMMRGRAGSPEEDPAPILHTALDTLDRVDTRALLESLHLSGRILRALADEENLPFAPFAPRPDEPRFYPDPG